MGQLLTRAGLAGLAAITIGCFGDLSTQSDLDPPIIQITSPLANDTVGGLVIIQATAADAFGVASVRFYIDDVLLFTDFVTPYQAPWNSTGLTGNHSIKAEARDEAGNSSSQTIGVVVGTIRN